jgi:D-alanyl-D-alanine carboxypeptidase/D-alanyl-D-alanine-endopeptidase (penicillin-binding protein 4)
LAEEIYLNTYGTSNPLKVSADSPLVSLVLFTFNQEQYILDALAGAVSQTYKPIEIVVCDDSSSDNTLAEVLAREVALAQGTTDFTKAIREGVGWAAEDWPDMYFRDGSGLSSLNQLSARAITTLLGDIATDSELSALRDALPVSAETGSLQRRFQSAGSLAAGAVSAKTGSIDGVRSLAGYLHASDGEELTFSLNLSGAGVSDAERSEIDQLVEGLYLCGENLAHWGIQADSTSE